MMCKMSKRQHWHLQMAPADSVPPNCLLIHSKWLAPCTFYQPPFLGFVPRSMFDSLQDWEGIRIPFGINNTPNTWKKKKKKSLHGFALHVTWWIMAPDSDRIAIGTRCLVQLWSVWEDLTSPGVWNQSICSQTTVRIRGFTWMNPETHRDTFLLLFHSIWVRRLANICLL